MSDGQRVLVVDDAEEIRTLIRRVLHTGGFQVETAATLAEARAMSPGGFEAVIVDANLGPDRGTDLVTGLQQQDPAATGRCLVITGGILGDMPAGVASLSKPFAPTQLLAAVRELMAHGPAPGSGTTATGEIPPHPSAPAPPHPAAGSPAHASAAPSAGGPLAGHARRLQTVPETASGGGGWAVLTLARDLRAREHAGLAGRLHDGPVQELTAAALGIHILRKQLPAAREQLDELAQRLEAASSALRRVTDSGPLAGQAPAGPEAAIRERTAWLLGEPAIVEVPPSVALTPAEAEAVADVTELVLLPLTDGVPQRAHIEVGMVAGGQLQIGATVTPCQPGPPASGGQPGEPPAGHSAAGHSAAGHSAAGHSAAGDPAGLLARALGGAAGFETGPDWCRARLTVPRANLTGPGPG